MIKKNDFQKLEENSDTLTAISDEKLEENLSKENSSFELIIKSIRNDIKRIDILDILTSGKIKDIKERAYPEEFLNTKKQIRLIYQGKLLKNEDNISELKLNPGFTIHSVINDFTEENNTQSRNSNDISNNNPVENIENDNDLEQNRIVEFILRREQEDYRRSNLNYPSEVLEGSTVDFIFGSLIGFFFNIFGLLLLVCLRFSLKARRGAILGLFLRIVFNTFHSIGTSSVQGNS